MSGCPASPLVPVDHPPVGFESQVAIASGTVGPDMPTPVPANERVDLLDAIRGVALGGILLANLMSFFGADMLGAEGRRAMPFGMAGERVLFGINWLVEGKFYSVFSMLLGAGFALQAGRAARAGTSAVDFDRFFRRAARPARFRVFRATGCLFGGVLQPPVGDPRVLWPRVTRASA